MHSPLTYRIVLELWLRAVKPPGSRPDPGLRSSLLRRCSRASLKVIAETDEEGLIGVVDPSWVTPSSLDEAHPARDLDLPPLWWTKNCLGDR